MIAGLLGRRSSPDADAKAILAEVEAAGPRDNATAIVIDVVRTGAPDWEAITAEAEGFLYKMVRSLAGVLIAVGEGKLTVANVEKILRARERTEAVKTAPPHALFLARVFY